MWYIIIVGQYNDEDEGGVKMDDDCSILSEISYPRF